MGTYYTKCGREFKKSTNAGVTGYHISEGDKQCEECPFQVEVKEGWPPVFKRWECRAGSKPPNQKNDWRGSLEDKNTISIRSLHNDFLGAVMAYCKTADDISAGYNQDLDDCRRNISVSCSANKKGVAAKKALIEKFFPTQDVIPSAVELEVKENCIDCAHCQPSGMGIDHPMQHKCYHADHRIGMEFFFSDDCIACKNFKHSLLPECFIDDCPFNDREGCCCFAEEPPESDGYHRDVIGAVDGYGCKNEEVLQTYKAIRESNQTDSEDKPWQPKCPYLNAHGETFIDCCAPHARRLNTVNFDSPKACCDKANNHCFNHFMDCEDYRKYYSDPSTWEDWAVPELQINFRTCSYCCNNSGYTSLPQGYDGVKWCFCQKKQEPVEHDDSPCEWFNRHPNWEINEVLPNIEKDDCSKGDDNLKCTKHRCPFNNDLNSECCFDPTIDDAHQNEMREARDEYQCKNSELLDVLSKVESREKNNGCPYYKGSKGPAVAKRPEIQCGDNHVLVLTTTQFDEQFQICNGKQESCRSFLFWELEKLGQRPQSDWDTEAMKDIYQSLVNEGVVVNHEDAKEVSQQGTCGTCDNYHPDAECPGTGRCPERMTIRAEGQAACAKHKPEICTTCENEDTGCAPNSTESGMCANYVDKKNTPACEVSQCPHHACMSNHCQLIHMIENVPHIVRETVDEVLIYCPDAERLVKSMLGGCGPVENIKCRINDNGRCRLDTASFDDMDAEAPNCGFIRVNDRYLTEKYGVPYKEFNCGSCSHHEGANCALTDESRYKGAIACSDFIKKEGEEVHIDSSQTCAGCNYWPVKGSTECNHIGVDRQVNENTVRCELYWNGEKDSNDNCNAFIPKDGTKAIETINETVDIVTFDYSTVDADTAAFLQEKEQKITQIRMMSVMAIGKELKEAQGKLANNKTGTFQSWVESLGITPKTAYNYINAHDYIVKNFHDISEAENIQPSLLFAISKPSAPKELQKAVLDGDITTHKQYKELEEKLKETEEKLYKKDKELKCELSNASQVINSMGKRLDKAELELKSREQEDGAYKQTVSNLQVQLAEANKVGDKGVIADLQKQLKEAQSQVEILKDELMKPVDLEPAVVEKVPEEIEQELAELRKKTVFAEDYNLIADILGKLITAHPGMLKNWAKIAGKENSKDSLFAIKGELIGIRTKLESMIDYLDDEIQMK